jgi:hypothetical protein
MRAAVQCLELTRIGKVQPSNTPPHKVRQYVT